jgi:hypothetical protein
MIYDFKKMLFSSSLVTNRIPNYNEENSRYGKSFLFSTTSRPTLGPTQPPIQWVPGAPSPGVKRQGRETDHSPPSSAEVKNGGAIPPLPPFAIMA